MSKAIADRILKLLALASSSQFAAEAETARRLAADLMRAHNITLEPGKPPQDTIEVRHHTPFAKGMKWEGMIIAALADLCSCHIFFNDDLTRYAIVGSIFNLDIFQYMLAEIQRQRIRAWMEHKGRGLPDSFNKFCFGYAKALKDKIDAMTDPIAVSTTRAALRLWYAAHRGIEITSSDALQGGRASSQAGLAAGGNASLHRGQLGPAARQIGYRGKP